MTSRWSLGVAVLAALFTSGAGCKRSSPEAPAGPATVSAPAQQVKSHSALGGAKQLERLPASTLAVAVAENPAELVKKLGHAQVADALGTTWTKAQAASVLFVGADLTTPAGFGAIGIDLAAPAGIAWLDAQEEVVALFASVSDPAKLRGFVDRMAAKGDAAVTAEEVGGLTLLRPQGTDEDEIALLYGAPGAWFVLCDRHEGSASKHARAIAAQAKDGSLAGAQRFRTIAVERLAYGADAAAWVDVQALVGAVKKEAAERGSQVPDYLERSLADAKASGDEDRVRRAQEDIDREKEWMAESAKRRTAETAAIEALLGSVDGIAVGAEVDGGSIRGRLVAPLREGSLLARGLRNAEGAPPVLRVLGEKPMLMLAGAVDPAVALEAFGLLLAADGDDLEEGLDALRRELGVDLRKDVLPALDGRVGFEMTADLEAILAAKDGAERLFGGAVVLGLKDAAAVKALLDGLWKREDLREIVTQDDKGRATVRNPDWRDVHIGVVGELLVVTTDPADFDRAGGAGRGALLEAGGVVAEIAGAEGGAVTGLYDHRFIGMLLAWMRFDFGEPPIDVQPGDSEERKRKIEAAQAARKRARALRDQVDQNQGRALLDITRSIGTMAGSARLDGGALVGQGALVTGHATVAEAAGDIARVALAAQEKAEALRRQLWDAEDEARRLSQELWPPADEGAMEPPPAAEVAQPPAVAPVPTPAQAPVDAPAEPAEAVE